jgi:hypothetical protein
LPAARVAGSRASSSGRMQLTANPSLSPSSPGPLGLCILLTVLSTLCVGGNAALRVAAGVSFERWRSPGAVWLRPVLFTGAVALGGFAAAAVVREEQGSSSGGGGSSSSSSSGPRRATALLSEATRRFLRLPGAESLQPLPAPTNPVVFVLHPPDGERWECRASHVRPEPEP